MIHIKGGRYLAMSENPEDSIDRFKQDFFSKIRSLKKAEQFYTLTRLLAGFMRSAQQAGINVSEYEYFLKKYYMVERTDKDLQPQEISVLLSAYDERLQSILDHNPPSKDPTNFVTTEPSLSEKEDISLILEVIKNFSEPEGDQEDLLLTKVKSLKGMAFDLPTPEFKSKESD